MPIYKTKQTYDVIVEHPHGVFSEKNRVGRYTSIVEARKKACQMAYTHVGEYVDAVIIKNPEKLADGTIRPAFPFIKVTSHMFIRPTYEFKYFGKERILKNGSPTDSFKYYVIDKNGNISLTDSSIAKYFDHTQIKSGVWEYGRRRR